MTALNPAQTAAVRHTETPLLVLAGAGSCKTRVITEKIAHLIQGKGLSARHIAAVTFTNKAAREMQARVRQLLAGQNTRGLTLSTFHTLGLKILRREAAAVGLRPGFTLYDARDAQALILDLMKRDAAADRDFAQRVQGRISLWKNAFLTPAQALAAAQDDFERAAAASFERYEQQIRAYNAVDLDEENEEAAFKKYMDDVRIKDREELRKIMRGEFRRNNNDGMMDEMEEDERERRRRMEQCE